MTSPVSRPPESPEDPAVVPIEVGTLAECLTLALAEAQRLRKEASRNHVDRRMLQVEIGEVLRLLDPLARELEIDPARTQAPEVLRVILDQVEDDRRDARIARELYVEIEDYGRSLGLLSQPLPADGAERCKAVLAAMVNRATEPRSKTPVTAAATGPGHGAAS